MSRVLLIGASGYVGRAVADAFSGAGRDVFGLARSDANIAQMKAIGVTPLLMASSFEEMAEQAVDFPLVVLAAKLRFPDEARLVKAILARFKGEDKTLILTSGTGVLSIAAVRGNWDENSFAEDDAFHFPALGVRKARLPIENMVRSASTQTRAMVIRLPLVWGFGGSDHIPRMFRCASDFGAVHVLGAGLNVISNVHVADAAKLYVAAAESGTAGALYHAVAGEVDFRSLARAVAGSMRCPVEHCTYERMIAVHGKEWVNLGLAVNSRSKAVRSRTELGWVPTELDVVSDIMDGSYKAQWS